MQGIQLTKSTFGQDWRRHECSPIEEGIHIYNFNVRIQGKDMQFWEETKTQLFRVSGQQFWERYGGDEVSANQVNEIMEGNWTIRYIKAWDLKGNLTIILNLTPVLIIKAL